VNTEDAKILNHRKRIEFLKDLRKKRTRQGQFENDFLHLDHPLPGGGRLLEASDRGKSAAEIRASAEEVPRWQKLWQRARRKLTHKQKRILDALLVDFRTSSAAEMARVSQRSIQHFKKTFFKMHFDQCYQAWKRDFGG